MNKRIPIFIALTAVIVLSISTIGFMPLPWFDEVFFADMTRSLILHNKLYLRFSPLYNHSEVLFYGPVYFYLQLFIAKIFSLDVLSFRLLNFLCGLGFLIQFQRCFKNMFSEKWHSMLFLLLLFIDPVFQFNLHSGRMDFVALFFSMLAFSWFLQHLKQQNFFKLTASGLLFSAAFLTTPRICFFLIPAFIYLLLCFGKSHVRDLTILIVISSLPVFIWIFARFGGPLSYLNYFLSNSGVAGHIGPVSGTIGLWRYHNYAIWYFLLLASALFLIINFIKKRKVNPETFLFAGTIVLFHLLVVERGPYSAMVVPFYAGFIALTLKEIPQSNPLKKVAGALIILNLLFFGLLFSSKTTLAFLNHSKTSENNLLTRLPMKMLEGKKVVGSFEYYYLMNANGSRFYGFQLGDINNRIHFHFHKIDFNYLLLTKQEAGCHQMIEYARGGKLVKIQNIEMPEDAGSRLAKRIADRFNLFLPDFSAELYVRVRE